MTALTMIDPRSLNDFRTVTKKQKMHGVAGMPWRCPVCKERKPIQGRKSRGWKMGFMCADCALRSG